MWFARALRLLVALVLPAGVAEGAAADLGYRAPVAGAGATWRERTAPLPAPSHNEATCVFCQAGVVQICPPPPAATFAGGGSPVRREPGTDDDGIPHLTSERTPYSRAPPRLRSA